ncbi:MAG: 6-phosphogluconolactonase [Gammaproteobacteria bacterium]|nr:6-phosphogluconolactonase [Gammaproteobacteria bacterium]
MQSESHRRVLDSADFYRTLAEEFVHRAAEAIEAHGRFRVALAGGSTPKPLYGLLAAKEFNARVAWAHTEVFFSDERCVPPDDARSNFRMAADALLKHVPLPANQLHRMRGEDDPALAALSYRQELAAAFRTVSVPRFDLILLGLGENGHTASLFPGTAALREFLRSVVPQYIEAQQEWRLTFTRPILNAAHQVWVLACGTAKAEIAQRVLEGRFEPEVLPAQYLAPVAGKLIWWLDAAAAARLAAVAVATE